MPSNIIRRNKEKEFTEADNSGRTMVFLEDINSAEDRKILETWENHLKAVGSPYIVKKRMVKGNECLNLLKVKGR